MRGIVLAGLAMLGGCAHADTVTPAIEVRTVTKTVEVQRPCPVKVPKRPKPLGALPTDTLKLVAVLGAKLSEWSGPGAYGDRADAALKTCTKSMPD